MIYRSRLVTESSFPCEGFANTTFAVMGRAWLPLNGAAYAHLGAVGSR